MNKICFITSSRADYGLMMNLMKLVKYDQTLKLQLIVTGSHLSQAHGQTYKEILKDGFKIDHKVKMPISKSTPDNITKATGIGMIGFAKVLKKLGFTEVGKDLIFSIARNEKISHTKVELIKT